MMENSKRAIDETTKLIGGECFDGLQTYQGRKDLSSNSPKTPKHTDGTDSVLVEHNDFKLSTIPRRSKVILSLCTTAMFLVSTAFSLLGPFYSLEAEKKGMSITVVGVVFGLFQIIIFIISPIVGNYLTTIGPKFCYIAGFIVGGVCNILFGTLNKSPSGTPFIVISLVVRGVEALGFAGFITAGFAIVSSEFPQNVGFAYGVLETGSGLGYMVGPTIGGALYELGGYGLPFYTVGVAVMLTGCVMYAYLPNLQIVSTKRKNSMFLLLRNPMVVIPLFSVCCGTIAITSFDATFAKHIQPFGLSTALIGLFFALLALIYSLMSTVWGYITDKKDIQAPIIVGGHFFYALGYLILAPSPLLPFIPFELWSVAIGLVLIGMSFGCTLIPTMKCMLKGAHEMGFERNMDTNAMVSGLFNSIHYLGGFIGPVGTGALAEEVNFRLAYSVLGLLHVLGMIVSLSFFSIRYFRRKGDNEPDNNQIPDCSGYFHSTPREYRLSLSESC